MNVDFGGDAIVCVLEEVIPGRYVYIKQGNLNELHS